jgi:plastocyanin
MHGGLKAGHLAAPLAAIGVAFAALSPHVVNASTSIVVTSGACADGGVAFCFSPESAAGTVGVAVTWTNMSGFGHTVTSCDASNCAGVVNTGSDTFSMMLGATNGSAVSFTFTNAGTYHYYCLIHGYSGMHGTIVIAAASTPTPTATATPTPTRSASPTPSPTSGTHGATAMPAPSTGAGLGVSEVSGSAEPSDGAATPATAAPTLATNSSSSNGGGFPLLSALAVFVLVLATGVAAARYWRRSRKSRS